MPRDAPRHSLPCSAASVIVLLCHTFVKSGQLCINVHIFIITVLQVAKCKLPNKVFTFQNNAKLAHLSGRQCRVSSSCAPR